MDRVGADNRQPVGIDAKITRRGRVGEQNHLRQAQRRHHLRPQTGAFDDLTRQRSTFMQEMNETANIVNNATSKSLVILDELGRGTATFDGMSIAWAVIEHIYENIGAKTLFATHYHQLNELENVFPGIKNYQVSVIEKNGQIVFLHKIKPGGTDKSYGIHVAKLAGLPEFIIKRSEEILQNLENDNEVRIKIVSFRSSLKTRSKKMRKKEKKDQIDYSQKTLF